MKTDNKPLKVGNDNLHFLLFLLHTFCKMAERNYTRKDQWETGTRRGGGDRGGGGAEKLLVGMELSGEKITIFALLMICLETTSEFKHILVLFY